MPKSRRLTLAAPPPDPFGERRRLPFQTQLQLLGGRFHFEANSARLLRIVHHAYERLPAHRFRNSKRRFKVSLLLTPRARRAQNDSNEPRPVQPLSGAGMLCGAVAGAGFTALLPTRRTGLIVVGQEQLRYSYHVRYELLEFAVYVLAARAQRLVPLHAACVGHAGKGVLVLGASGGGKSTLMLHALLAGLDFLAEDSVLIKPQELLATGVANFVHLRPDSLRFLTAAERRSLLRHSVEIRRRSGMQKLEIDLRQGNYRLAPAPLKICAVVSLSRRAATAARPLLTPMEHATLLRRLVISQRYAAHQPGWSTFCRRLAGLPAYELRRGQHPRAGVAALQDLLL